MYFTPSFFDIMVHLIVHLVREIRICDHVFLRWIYPIESCMKIFKGYVKNPYRPEASIVERYIVEEAIEFCTTYMSKVDALNLTSLSTFLHQSLNPHYLIILCLLFVTRIGNGYG